jgi:hypothetical protein
VSVLSFPRVNFRGVFRTNPCTCNNDDVMPAIVERDADTFGETIAPGMTDDQIAAFLRQPVVMSNDPTGACTPFIRSGWNLYGDHTTSFEQVVVTSVVTGAGAAGRSTSAAQDPLVGQPVLLLGGASADPMRRGTPMLCDLDPTGLVTTQLYVGGLQIGSGADPSETVVFDHDTRAFQNWLHFMATLGPYGGDQNFVGIGCLMQFAIPTSAIAAQVAFQSLGLQALLTAARAAAGLVVRFRCFEVEPGIRDENLAAAFQQGQPLENPAFGYLIGTIGPWGTGEPETEPAGRKLVCPYPRPGMSYADPQGAKTPWPPQPTPWTPKLPPALVGNAVAWQHDTPAVISLDLVDAFPKYGYRNPDGPQKPGAGGFDAPRHKANLGPVELAVIPSGGGAPLTIATIDYGLDDYSTYEDFGGIVDITYDTVFSSTIAGGTLVIRGTAASPLNPGTTLLQETPVRVVTDDRALYLLPSTPGQARIKVYDRGLPPSADQTIYLYEYYNVIQSQAPSTCADQTRPNQTVAQDPRGLLTVPAQVTFPAGSVEWLAIPISTRASGATILAYQTSPTRFGDGNEGGVTGVPAWAFADYSSIRVFEDVSYPQFAAGEPIPWDFVYQEVLRFYYLVYPAMSRVIPLNAPDGLVRAASLVAQRMNTPDQPGFYSTYNMPVTRTMPPGKVRLVLDFLAQQQAARRPPA